MERPAPAGAGLLFVWSSVVILRGWSAAGALYYFETVWLPQSHLGLEFRNLSHRKALRYYRLHKK